MHFKFKSIPIWTVTLSMIMLARAFCAEPMKTAEDVCRVYPEKVQFLFAHLDLTRPGLEAVRKAVEEKKWPAACEELLTYYRRVRLPEYYKFPHFRDALDEYVNADEAMKGIYVFGNYSAPVPQRPGGGWDWNYLGPKNDKEWGWGMSRHYHLRKAYQEYVKTGRKDYIQFINTNFQDWLVALPAYPAKSWSSDKPSTQWRGLEVGIRLSVWTELFYALLDQPEMTTPTWILMFATVPDHAHYLQNFHGGGNWLVCEFRGLADIAASWPEFKDSPTWREKSLKTLADQILWQVYPDGAHIELSSDYHCWVAQEFQSIADLALLANYPLPKSYHERLESMWNYLAYAVRPNGCAPNNNDAGVIDIRPFLKELAPRYHRPDWIYIITHGKEGKKPEGLPSHFYPWAGQAVMRSGWDKDAQWAFFDVGPLGFGGHIHQDKLNLSIYAHGRDLLVDSGIYHYIWDAKRQYMMTSAAHNVMLVDGQGQASKELCNGPQTKEPIAGWAITPQYDYARGGYDQGFRNIADPVKHERVVVYPRRKYWVVIDRVDPVSTHTLQFLWHFSPQCTVAIDGFSVKSVDKGLANLCITPVSGLDWELHVTKGQTDPEIQGWYSRAYGEIEPNATAIYSVKVGKPVVFAWILTPARGQVPGVKGKLIEVKKDRVILDIESEQGNKERITIPFEGKPEIKISSGRE